MALIAFTLTWPLFIALASASASSPSIARLRVSLLALASIQRSTAARVVSLVGGKGRFATVKGDGTLTGTRYTPLSIGADLVSDYTISLRYEDGSGRS
jgi:hypothetical protein